MSGTRTSPVCIESDSENSLEEEDDTLDHGREQGGLASEYAASSPLKVIKTQLHLSNYILNHRNKS